MLFDQPGPRNWPTRSGFEVVVLEAQNRPGGRAYTVRDPFINGGYAELGALRIPNVHVHTNKYIEELVLKEKIFEYNEAELAERRR